MIKIAMQHFVIDFGIKFVLDNYITEFKQKKHITYNDLYSGLMFKEINHLNFGSFSIKIGEQLSRGYITKMFLAPYAYAESKLSTLSIDTYAPIMDLSSYYYIICDLDNGSVFALPFMEDFSAYLK